MTTLNLKATAGETTLGNDGLLCVQGTFLHKWSKMPAKTTMAYPKLKGVEPQCITGKSPVILLTLVLIFFHQRWQDENLGRSVPSHLCLLWLVVKALGNQGLYPQTTGRKKI